MCHIGPLDFYTTKSQTEEKPNFFLWEKKKKKEPFKKINDAAPTKDCIYNNIPIQLFSQ